jgi:hypothetical protein
MAFDPKTWRIFLPAADIETIPAAKPSERPQRKIWPGTFNVLVVGES